MKQPIVVRLELHSGLRTVVEAAELVSREALGVADDIVVSKNVFLISQYMYVARFPLVVPAARTLPSSIWLRLFLCYITDAFYHFCLLLLLAWLS